MSRKRRQPVPDFPGQTRGEALVRHELMRRRIQFEQEAELGPYRVDFLIEAAKAVIEVDGFSHWTVPNQNRDTRKDDYLQREGYIVFRFTDEQLQQNAGRCLNEVERHVRIYRSHRQP